MTFRRLVLLLSVALLALALPVSSTSATTKRHAKRITYKFGPVDIKPGQNTISFAPNNGFTEVPGYITRFKPDLVRVSDGSIPRVDVLHLHHAVWLVNSRPQSRRARKTIVDLPSGYGWRSTPNDRWIMNHMIHNLYQADRVYVTYTIDFIPDTSPQAKKMKTVDAMDGRRGPEGGLPGLRRAEGQRTRGKFTYPTQAPDAYRGESRRRNEWVVDQDSTLIGTAAHLHRGLYGDLWLKRGDRKVRLFRSRAKYYEPAGAVSWDVSMEATPNKWRVAVKKGDVISVTGTYESKRAAWYESMAIMPIAVRRGSTSGLDPFKDRDKIDVRGKVTRWPPGREPQPRRAAVDAADARQLVDGPVMDGGTVNIGGFVYQQGDMIGQGAANRPPVISQGQSLTYFEDAPRQIEHTITACKAPCNRTTGIALPLADADVGFDSGQLGFGPRGATAAQRDTWQTPASLKTGTYTYFCRVHPFMRGSFRVK